MKYCFVILMSMFCAAPVVGQTTDYAAKGYRGFIELGVAPSIKSWRAVADEVKYDADNDTHIFVGNKCKVTTTSLVLSTSHGYQSNEHLFVGGGLLAMFTESNKIDYIDHCLDPFAEITGIAYLDARYDLKGKSFSPFCEARVGTSSYFSLAVGIHYKRINFATAFDTYYNSSHYVDWSEAYHCVGFVNSLSFRLSIDWGAR